MKEKQQLPTIPTVAVWCLLLLFITLFPSCRILEIGSYSLNTIMPLRDKDIYEWKMGKNRIITKGLPESADFGDSLELKLIKHGSRK